MARVDTHRFSARRLALSLAALGATLLWAPRAHAFEAYVGSVPNPVSAMSGDVSRECITCHNNPDGGSGCNLLDPVANPLGHCWNPFGKAFYDNGLVWDATLADLDSDIDGYTNGEELQDFAGTWTIGQPYPGVRAYATRPGFPNSTPASVGTDADGDDYCWVGQDMNGDGDCLDPGEHTSAIDCNDGSATAHTGAPELCTNTGDDDCDGLATLADPECADVVDGDGDGFCVTGQDLNGNGHCLDSGEANGMSDCDDGSIIAYPGAAENCVDGADNDCDGDVDAADSQCTGEVDADGDHYCPIGQDLNLSGNCLDVGEDMQPSDCNDQVASVNPGQPEICNDAYDNDCDGLANLDDPDCAAFLDVDGDGRCPTGRDTNGDGDCIDAGEDTSDVDCDDGNPLIYLGAPELCEDLVDQDCDGFGGLDDSDCFIYVDMDGDFFCPRGVDKNGDGDCIDAGGEGALGAVDCDDGDAAVNPVATEACFDGVDNDCNTALDEDDPACDGYVDYDGDRYCQPGIDDNLDGDCTDPGEQTPDLDARPYDPTTYPYAHENCLDGLDNDQDGDLDALDADCTGAVDADGDGFCALGRDGNGDGDCLDDDEAIEASDCNDANAEVFPGAIEMCARNVDSDCDGKVYLDDADCLDRFADRDGDGFCGEGVDDDGDGLCVSAAEDRFGHDCDDANAQVSPRAVENCADAVDNDCDGLVDRNDPNCRCVIDGDCPHLSFCTIAACRQGVCRYQPNPVCEADDCAVATPGAGGGSGRGWALLLGLAGLAVAVARRRRAGRGVGGGIGLGVVLFLAMTPGEARAYETWALMPGGVSYPGCATCHQTDIGGCAGSVACQGAYCNLTAPCGTCPNNGYSDNGYCHSRFGWSIWNNGTPTTVSSHAAHVWNAAMARVDSDLDGWSDGQEVGDPFGECTCTSYDVCSCPFTRVPLSNPWDGASRPAESAHECDRHDCDAVGGCAAAASDGGSFTCSCPSGYTGDGHTKTGLTNANWGCTGGWQYCYTVASSTGCTDIDECLSATCDVNATCRNYPGTFECACNEGYVGTGLAGSCVDVNECASGTGGCAANEVCVNRLGDANLCVCAPGYTRLAPGAPCTRTCGDGVRAKGEECDDGDLEPGDGCDERCAIEPGWACAEPDASALSVCTETCGDGVLRIPGEECDDGADNSDAEPNACRTSCRVAYCGDGVVDDGEGCDDGAQNSDLETGACRTSCKPAFCGDGVRDEGEHCDFGVGVELAPEECVDDCFTLPGGVSGGGSSGGCVVAGPGAGGRGGEGAFVVVVVAGLVLRRRGRA